MSGIVIDCTICKKDYFCIQECPARIFKKGEDGFPVIDEERVNECISCGHCQAVCPHDAIILNDQLPANLQRHFSKSFDWSIIEGLIKSRRSVRRYQNKPLNSALVDKLLDVTRWAPTGGNRQLVQWLFIEKPQTMEKIANAVADWARGIDQMKFLAETWDKGYDMILRGAPHLAIAYAGNEYGSTPADCTIAASTLDLVASSQGVGTCWAGFFLMACGAGYAPLLNILDLPPDNKVYAALMMGYPQYGFSRIPQRKGPRVRKM